MKPFTQTQKTANEILSTGKPQDVPTFKSWDEFVRPNYIVVTMNDGRKIKIAQSTRSRKAYQLILHGFVIGQIRFCNRMCEMVIENLKARDCRDIQVDPSWGVAFSEVK